MENLGAVAPYYLNIGPQEGLEHFLHKKMLSLVMKKKCSGKCVGWRMKKHLHVIFKNTCPIDVA